MGLTTCKWQSGKLTGLIYGEIEGPPFCTEDSSMPPEARSCSSRAGVHLAEPALPREEGGRRSTALPESPALMSISLPGSPHRCHPLPLHPCPHCSVTPVTTLVTTRIVRAFTCNSRDKCKTSLFPFLLPRALWHRIRGKV